jgi:hypothetical protein
MRTSSAAAAQYMQIIFEYSGGITIDIALDLVVVEIHDDGVTVWI